MTTLTRATTFARMALLLSLFAATPARAIDDAHHAKAQAAIQRGIAYLRSTQGEDGSWTPKPGPAVTALALVPMLERPDLSPADPAVAKGLAYVMSKVRPDGGIHDGILENYNTAICLMALSRINAKPQAAAAIAAAQDYLRTLQWSGQRAPDGSTVDEQHPFHGGAGYGSHGRPDMSNTQIMIQGLHDSGLDCNDPAFQRAMVFISRCQAVPSNTAFAKYLSNDGGFIYATSIDKDHLGVPQSMASPQMIDEAKAGRPVSGLRSYGSMTYAGFKSYLYAQLDRNDPRVTAALDWARRNYTLDQNPGMPEPVKLQGLYYYYLTFAKALRAWGSTTLDALDADGQVRPRDWANDLIDALTARQREDGSWINEADRWMEGDANLVTAYALIALTEATR